MEQPPDLENPLGPGIWTLPAMLQRRAELSGAVPALWNLSAEGVWRSTNWIEYRDAVTHIAGVLRELGLAPGDCVGIMAPSSQYWDFVQMGVLTMRGVVVGLDPHDRDDNLNTVARHCQLTGLIVHDPAWANRFEVNIREQWQFIISLQPTTARGVIVLDRIVHNRSAKQERLVLAAQPDDPATIIFTSGTTGAPKGIQYTHRQVCLAAASILKTFPGIGAESRLICWLPLSNLFQRMINACAIGCGAQTYYVEDPRAVMRYIGDIEPHLFIGVPRFYEKLYAGIMGKIQQEPLWRRQLVTWALSMGERSAEAIRTHHTLDFMERAQIALANHLVLRRLRSIMGSRLRYLVSGSAPMPRWLLERFQAMDLLVLEAYGLSENIIPVSANRPDAYRFGTVGRALQGSEVRLAEDGELWVRGPGVFNGYYGEERDDNQFDADGYLASGDFASIDNNGFITLTGRKSEIFKTSTGRRIAPAGIESVLRQLPYIEHAVVFGAHRPFLIAVLAVAEEALRARAGANAESSTPEAWYRYIQQDLAPGLASLADYQRPAGAIITTQAFSIERGELTSNLKLRRANVEATYQAALEELYHLLEAANSSMTQIEHNGSRIILCSL